MYGLPVLWQEHAISHTSLSPYSNNAIISNCFRHNLEVLGIIKHQSLNCEFYCVGYESFSKSDYGHLNYQTSIFQI